MDFKKPKKAGKKESSLPSEAKGQANDVLPAPLFINGLKVELVKGGERREEILEFLHEVFCKELKYFDVYDNKHLDFSIPGFHHIIITDENNKVIAHQALVPSYFSNLPRGKAITHGPHSCFGDSVELKLLAIDQEHRMTQTFKLIIQMIYEVLCHFVHIRYLTTNAVPEFVQLYETIGFVPVKQHVVAGVNVVLMHTTRTNLSRFLLDKVRFLNGMDFNRLSGR